MNSYVKCFSVYWTFKLTQMKMVPRSSSWHLQGTWNLQFIVTSSGHLTPAVYRDIFREPDICSSSWHLQGIWHLQFIVTSSGHPISAVHRDICRAPDVCKCDKSISNEPGRQNSKELTPLQWTLLPWRDLEVLTVRQVKMWLMQYDSQYVGAGYTCQRLGTSADTEHGGNKLLANVATYTPVTRRNIPTVRRQ
jgi:hypothetical protein